MTTPDLTEADALIMAAQCPLIIAAYRTGDDDVIRRMEATHPAERCHYVKQAHAAASSNAGTAATGCLRA